MGISFKNFLNNDTRSPHYNTIMIIVILNTYHSKVLNDSIAVLVQVPYLKGELEVSVSLSLYSQQKKTHNNISGQQYICMYLIEIVQFFSNQTKNSFVSLVRFGTFVHFSYMCHVTHKIFNYEMVASPVEQQSALLVRKVLCLFFSLSGIN